MPRATRRHQSNIFQPLNVIEKRGGFLLEVPWMLHIIDDLRRSVGLWCDAAGLGGQETPYRVTKELRGALLRHYPSGHSSPTLVIPAPIKRPYIWDLRPDISVIRCCLAGGLRVYLLEWTRVGPGDDYCLEDYALRLIGEASDQIEAETGEATSILAGNSLGGTLAAIFASLRPRRVRGLALIDAPLAFGGQGDRLARLAKATPDQHFLTEILGDPVCGSTLNLLSMLSMPEVFLWQRYGDFAASLVDPDALDLHLRVLRWSLDEFPLPGQFFADILEQLYKKNRFALGTLMIAGQCAAVQNIGCPVFAVLNPVGHVVPPSSVETALCKIRGSPVQFQEYEGETGIAFQHLGPLISHVAHKRLWPAFLQWTNEISTRP